MPDVMPLLFTQAQSVLCSMPEKEYHPSTPPAPCTCTFLLRLPQKRCPSVPVTNAKTQRRRKQQRQVPSTHQKLKPSGCATPQPVVLSHGTEKWTWQQQRSRQQRCRWCWDCKAHDDGCCCRKGRGPAAFACPVGVGDRAWRGVGLRSRDADGPRFVCADLLNFDVRSAVNTLRFKPCLLDQAPPASYGKLP